jgi:hypothetical protein
MDRCDAEVKAAAADRRMFVSASWVHDRWVGHLFYSLRCLENWEDHGFMRVYRKLIHPGLCAYWSSLIKAVFTFEIFGGNIPVALSLLFGKNYPTMN